MDRLKPIQNPYIYPQMRSSGPPRPPFPGGMPPRPMGAPGPRPGGPPMPTGPGVRPGGPPPLRSMDSRGNLLMGPGAPGPRPGGPPQNPQIRPPSSSGPQSPTGQGAPRPQGAFPWPPQAPGQPPQQSNATANRPPNPFPGNNQTAPNRPPFNRPPGPPGSLQQQQQQPQTRPQAPHQQPQRPPSSLSTNDDDDVVMGQAVTPQKSAQFKTDPMGPTLIEEEEAVSKDDSPASMIKTSDLSLTSPDSFANDSSFSKSPSGEVTSPISSKIKHLLHTNSEAISYLQRGLQ